MHRAVEEAVALGFQSVQVFTKNQQQWKVRPLEPTAIDAWKAATDSAGFTQTVSHDSYLINLASPDDTQWERSVELFLEEVRRCELLGIPYLVTHPGAHMGSGERAGIRRIAAALNRVHSTFPKAKVIICLETTAGMGSSIGHRLEHLEQIIAKVRRSSRLGVCLDTAHLFAAGYDFRGRRFAGFRRELETRIGLDRVRVIHLNDSKKELGSRVDRHEHIGRGKIGLEGFKPILRDRAFSHLPGILETPKLNAPDGTPWDIVNLQTLQSLCR